ncbi:cell division site-positioning protein MapZ family protein [Streptococcus ovis]|uniref:cell division site-positioning protein MapZ family protein n=1 Tax=Streptococcus ovis TaxID=82806 RepID=UPI00037888CD|nr:cell division site-positioning protein MapZ family protein [Streptococcus ovis]
MAKKKRKQYHPKVASSEEKNLEFDAAKEMTVGQIARRQKELQDGVEENDNILDRYIKQHREDIEAEKFETIISSAPLVPEEVPMETPDETTEIEAQEKAADIVEPELQPQSVEPEQVIVADSLKTPIEPLEETEDVVTETNNSGKKKAFVWGGLGTILLGSLAGAYIWFNSSSPTSRTSSTTASKQTTTSSSSEKDANVTAFETLYKTFFTDSSQTKIKNDMFGKLPELKTALEKIGSTAKGYGSAKAKYEALEKAIKAIQTINGQFDKSAIVNGELDTTATVKANATFTATTTGLSAVDALLTSAINFGRTQDVPKSSEAPAQTAGTDSGNNSVAAATPAPSPAPAPSVEPAGNVQNPAPAGNASTGGLYGIPVPAGVTLQRNLSRVPYDQSKIDDVNNEAWIFNPGVLEKIIAISQQRGYIVGNQYILEKVNIINGRGYYNLFRPDGTYLFSINCKTGYFVGNGAGYADDVDF